MVNGILKCNKIMVIGCPGGGKSTFARALGEITKLPVYHWICFSGMRTRQT